MTKLEEIKTISKIAKRAAYALNGGQEHFSIMMDIETVHEKNPLRLKEFLETDNGNFMHDIVGIINNLNRKTKELENGFSPRYTA